MSILVPTLMIAALGGAIYASSRTTRTPGEEPEPMPPSLPASAVPPGPPPDDEAVFWHPDRGWLHEDELLSLSEAELAQVSGRVNLNDATLIGAGVRFLPYRPVPSHPRPVQRSAWPGASRPVQRSTWPGASRPVQRSTWPGASRPIRRQQWPGGF